MNSSVVIPRWRSTQHGYRKTNATNYDDNGSTTTMKDAPKPGKSANYRIGGKRGVHIRDIIGNVQSGDVQFNVVWTQGLVLWLPRI